MARNTKSILNDFYYIIKGAIWILPIFILFLSILKSCSYEEYKDKNKEMEFKLQESNLKIFLLKDSLAKTKENLLKCKSEAEYNNADSNIGKQKLKQQLLEEIYRLNQKLLAAQTGDPVIKNSIELFGIDKNCKITIENLMQEIAEIVERNIKNYPFSSTSVSKKTKDLNSCDWIFLRDGLSNILTSNPRYETSIYFLGLYPNKEYSKIILDFDFVILVSGGANDARTLIGYTDRINKYRDALYVYKETIQNTLMNKYPCLKKL